MPLSVPRRIAAAAAAVILAAAAAAAQPQAESGVENEPLESVVRRVNDPLRDPGERRELRMRHGLWTEDDLQNPRRQARAALVTGAWDHPSLDDQAADPIDRAEAQLLRGDPKAALDTLTESEDRGSMRAVRIRAQALSDLGRYQEADAAVAPAIDKLSRRRAATAAELAEGVRALMIRANVRGPERAGGADYNTLLDLLRTAREEIDRLDPLVRLVEAELLRDKHNNAEAFRAAREALERNPQMAAAWHLLGEIMVDSFSFDEAESIAAELEALAAPFDSINTSAAMIRARARLRQRDPEGARNALAVSLATYPNHRAALALEAAAWAAEFETQRLQDALAYFDTISPGSAQALYAVGASLSEARQYAPAAAYLRRASERLPNWPHPLIELGLLELQAGRDTEAKQALDAALALDRFNTRATNSLRLVSELETYDTLEGEHFEIRYRPGIDAILAREMLPAMEAIHARLASPPTEPWTDPLTGNQLPGGLGHEPARKTLIELMPNHRWFSVRITGITQIHTIAAATGPVIAMESPQVGPDFSIGEYDWSRVLQHEYTHTVTLSLTNNRIPHWFTEASAVFYEDKPRDENTWRLLAAAFNEDRLFDLEQINIAFVRPERPTDRSQAYAQGHWMYQYIAERWSPKAPVDLMKAYAAGTFEEDAFQDVLGLSRDDFMQDFRTHAEADLRAHGMLTPVNAPSLTDLITEARDALPKDERDEWTPGSIFAEKILAEHPDHPDVVEFAATILIGSRPTRLTEDDIALLRRYAELRPVADLPHRLLARHELQTGTPEALDRAIPHLEFLDARAEYTTVFAEQLAYRYAEIGSTRLARAKAERCTKIAPFDADMRELAARVAITERDYTAAERHIQALIDLEPDRDIHKQRLDALRELATR